MLNEINGGQTTLDRALAAGVWQESPLVGAMRLLKQHQAAPSPVFRLIERPFLELVNVRGDPRDPAFMAAVEAVVGVAAPASPNTVTRGARYDMLWLGPDEWLVRSTAPHDAASSAPLEGALREAFRGLFASATDVGSGYTVLDIRGAGVREVLARGCPLDLHPRQFAVGQCAQSFYFKASVTLLATGDASYELVVRRSFADYFVKILLDAAAPLLS
ncbi:MAG: sarcosine oxidase subunit gamma [Janthinobacterium lividum]